MVDLTAAPFSLDATGITWVERTIASLSLEEKIGQLFINLNTSFERAYLDGIIDNFHVGGMRYMGADSRTVQDQIRYAQSRSKVPLLVASNPEMGGAGSISDGTLVTTHRGAGSYPDTSIARDLGAVGGRRPPRSAATGRSHRS